MYNLGITSAQVTVQCNLKWLATNFTNLECGTYHNARYCYTTINLASTANTCKLIKGMNRSKITLMRLVSSHLSSLTSTPPSHSSSINMALVSFSTAGAPNLSWLRNKWPIFTYRDLFFIQSNFDIENLTNLGWTNKTGVRNPNNHLVGCKLNKSR